MYPFGYGAGLDWKKLAKKLVEDRLDGIRHHWCNEDGHEPVDTGLLKGWCKHCNVTMWFDRTTGKYTPEVEEKK